MSKHIVDTNRSRTGTARSAQFAKLDAAEKPAPQTKLLQRQPIFTDQQARAQRFLKLERQDSQRLWP